MIREIQIEYIKEELITKLKNPLEEESFIEKIEIDKENSLFKIYYEENKENFFGLTVLSALSLSLCIDYICFYSKYKHKEKEKKILLEAITSDAYYANTLLINLISYFKNNSLLKEKIFFKFNMNEFDKELELIIEDFEFENIMNKAKDNIHEMLKENGIDFKNYSTMQIVFDENDCFSLKAKDGSLLNPKTTSNLLGLDIEFEPQIDDFLTIITFCDLMISVLKIKTLIIPTNYENIYNALLEQQNILQNEVKLVLKDV